MILRLLLNIQAICKKVYKNIEEYNLGKKLKVLIVFDDMITDVINNKKLNPIVTELFIRDRKINISIVFITQSYFKVPKEVRINTTHFFYHENSIWNRSTNNSSNIDSKNFMKMKHILF